MSQISISGAVSGLDTATIINQLIAVEGRQQAMIKAKQDKADKAAATYAQVISSLNAVAKQASELATTSSWVGTTASSTKASVAVTPTGSVASSLTFAVTSLAASHALVSANAVSSTGATVAAGPLTLTSGGTTQQIDVGTGSLSDVVSAINKADAGVRANSVLVAPGEYRLQVTSTSSGSASEFTLAGITGFTGMNVLAQGTDAQITVGSNPLTSYEVVSSTNTFSGVLSGLSFTVSALETDVTVASTVDGSAVADKIKSMVDAANGVISTMDKNTAWDATTRTGGALFGESAVRRLRQSLLSVVGGANAPGVETTRSGTLSFDRAAFLAAFADDPQKVAEQFGAETTFAPGVGVTGDITLSSMGDLTRTGTYAVNLTQAPAREQWEITLPGDLNDLVGQSFTLGRGSTTVTYEIEEPMTAAQVAAALNELASAAGLRVTTSVGVGSLVLTASATGAGGAFTADHLDAGAASTGSAARTVTGADVAGTIDGQAAKGSGGLLQRTSGTGGALGLVLNVGVAQTGAVGSVSVTTGLAQSLRALLEDATDADTGYLSSAQDGRKATATDLQKQYDAWTSRLEIRKLALTRQFTAMETALASLQSRAGFLAGL